MPYHHGNLREALVDAAVELAAKAGPDAVALREVARHVGVSHNAAYRHFADRDELLRAATARVLTSFGELMARRIASATDDDTAMDPIEAAYARFQHSGRAYVEFATGSPGLFRLVCAFTLGEIGPDGDVAHPYTQLTERLDELVATGATTAERRQYGEIAAVSAVHGYAMWVLDGPARDASRAEREAGLEAVLSMVRFGI